MNTPLYIARRYLLAKKSHNAINIISAISVAGVAVGTLALIVILSVFNGFESLITSLFNSFDPDLRITAAEGKTFVPDSAASHRIKGMPGIIHYTEVIEDNALLSFEDKQYIATVKGVSDNYASMTGIDSMMVDGDFILRSKNEPYAVIGQGVAYFLSVGLSFVHPIFIYVPKKMEQISFDPEEAFTRQYIFPSGIFSIEKDIDVKYILVPIDFARTLFNYTQQINAIELQIGEGSNLKKIQHQVQELMGPSFVVKNRYQQKEFFYKVMKSEKYAIFFILSFILIVASFNIIGSLTMLIIDKKKDMYILRSLGATPSLIRNIFLFEGWMISCVGALIGLILGVFICWVQITFGLLKLQGQSAFIVSAYPVDMQPGDIAFILLVVLIIGFIACWYPVRYITKKHLTEIENN